MNQIKKKYPRRACAAALAGMLFCMQMQAFALEEVPPAFTPVCGLKEHTHTDACYQVQQRLICGFTEKSAEEIQPQASPLPTETEAEAACKHLIPTEAQGRLAEELNGTPLPEQPQELPPAAPVPTDVPEKIPADPQPESVPESTTPDRSTPEPAKTPEPAANPTPGPTAVPEPTPAAQATAAPEPTQTVTPAPSAAPEATPGHVHTPECYQTEKVLICKLQEHQDGPECAASPQLQKAPAVQDIVWMQKALQPGVYWKRIPPGQPLQAGQIYLVLSAEAGNVLCSNSPYGAPVVPCPVRGNPDYYRIDNIQPQMLLRYTQEYGGALHSGSSYLDPAETETLFVPDPVRLMLEAGAAESSWSIRAERDGSSFYLNYWGEHFLGNTNQYLLGGYYRSARTADMMLFQLVEDTLTIPELVPPDPGSGNLPAEKPGALPVRAVSPAKQGSWQQQKDVTAVYASDPATSQLEAEFFEAPQADGDGRVLMDKSVVYGRDDYQAFSQWKQGQFGVTLSMLGQGFNHNAQTIRIPVDVVFVLDTSGSMNHVDSGQSKSRAHILVDAMNDALKVLMDYHPENRVCAVTYNSGAQVLMQPGRYTPDSQGRYLVGEGSSIRVTQTGIQAECTGGTFTQMGIALGAQLIQQITDTEYRFRVNGQEVAVPRKPVIILISDGEPTHCSPDYMDVLHSPYYGDGRGIAYNNKGIQGYYTILSAAHYKRMVGIHYQNAASMYTVGFGMEAGDTTLPQGTSVTNHYRATVMDPTPANVALLEKISTGYEASVENQLYQLLQGTFAGHAVWVGAYSPEGSLKNPHALVPVNQQDDIRPDFAYADRSYLGNVGYEGLEQALEEIIDLNSRTNADYRFTTREELPLQLTDPIGEGMQLQSAPVLRCGGVNYAPVSQSTQGNTVEYRYSGVVPMDPASGRTVDLSLISVQVTTDAQGRQTVHWSVPPQALPVLAADQTLSWYYPALPLRLVYQVGLTEAAEQRVVQLEPGQSCIFHTNRWQQNAQASGTMAPAAGNGFYQSPGWQHTVPKTENPTQTSLSSRAVDGSPAQEIQYRLGNNGRLVFKRDELPKEITVLKKWQQEDGTPQTQDLPASITAALYRTWQDEQGAEQSEDVIPEFTLTAQQHWRRTFTEAELHEMPGRAYRYYVREQTPEGYTVTFEGDGVAQNTPDTPLCIINRSIRIEVVLPETGGAGTAAFYVWGGLLAAAALLQLIRTRTDKK